MSAPEQKDPETKDIEYNEEQKKILENIEKQIGKIKEIENITIGENESLVNIKEHLEPIPERIRKLRNDLLEKLDTLKKELKRLQDEADNDNSLKNITEMIQTSIKEIDNLTQETGNLTETKEKINQAIEDKIKEARDKEIPEADKETKDLAKEVDEATLNTKEKSGEKKDDYEISYQDVFKDKTTDITGHNIQSTADVDNSTVPPHMQQVKVDPFIKDLDRGNAVRDAKNKSNLSYSDQEKMRKHSSVSGRKRPDIHKSRRNNKPQNSKPNAGGKRTRKRRNSRKKKVVKRR